MRKILLFACIAIGLMACKRSTIERSGIVGKWKLSASLADPGDGSGKWHAANPFIPSYIEFLKDGTISNTPANPYAAGHYRLTSDSTLLLIWTTNSVQKHYRIDRATLTLTGGCDEACGERYLAVE